MFHTTRVIYTPSVNKFLRFRDFRNEHLFALFKNKDSLVDSICTQKDILEDCWIETEYSLDDLTLFDVFVIFLTWRINCVNNEIILDLGHTHETHEIENWLYKAINLGSQNFEKSYTEGDITLTFNILNIRDEYEVYREQMMNDLDDNTVFQENSKKLVSLCALRECNGAELTTYQERERTYRHLPASTHHIFEDYREFIEEHFVTEDFLIYLGGDRVHFKLELIPILIKYVFTGSSESLIDQSMYLAKKANMNYDTFMGLAPAETTNLIGKIKDSEEDSSEDQLIE